MTIFADMITLDDIRKPVTAELEALDEFVDRQFTAEGVPMLFSISAVAWPNSDNTKKLPTTFSNWISSKVIA